MSKQVRVVVTYEQNGLVQMRWERASESEGANTYELIGRAFEAVQREEHAAFADALQAFFKGAMIAKADVEHALLKME